MTATTPTTRWPSDTAASTFPSWITSSAPIPDSTGKGERAVTFLRSLRHPNADNRNSAPITANSNSHPRAFQLFDWQERLVRKVYSPRHSDGLHVVKTVFLMLPRGGRKTSLAAA